MYILNLVITCCVAFVLIVLALANCWVIQHPFPIYKTFSGGARVRSSIPYFDRVIESDPKNWTSYYERGCAYDQIGCLQLALSDYNQALKLNPADVSIIDRRSNLLYRIGAFKESLADRNWLIAKRGASPYDYAERSRIFEQLGQKEQALTDARHAVRLAPDLADAHLVLAYALLATGNSADAMSECCSVRAQLPLQSRSTAELCAAQIFIAKKQWLKSIECCNKVLSKNSYVCSAFWLRALDHYNLGKYDQAVADATNSICQNPMIAAPYLIRAEAYCKLDRNDEGARDRRTAAKLDPHLKNVDEICYQVFPY